MPELDFQVHEAGVLPVEDLTWIEECLLRALVQVVSDYPGSVLAELELLECSLVDDATLAQVHGEYCGDASPTDVITFPHGEILVSSEMAERRAKEFDKTIAGEALLYLVHGLMHLAGYDDKNEADASEMAKAQEKIWEACQVGASERASSE